MLRWKCVTVMLIVAWLTGVEAAEELPRGWPKLPSDNAPVEIPGQEWPVRPVPRHVKIRIYYPFSKLEHVSPTTGLMLSLHNWGGTDSVGTADPKALAERYNVVAITVDYLQSGKHEGFDATEPYDFGYLQSLDALRALWYVQQGLKAKKLLFHADRIYVVGGSSGGHMALMCNKLAPRTFNCVVSISGMPALTDDVAFGLQGGSHFKARWSQVPGEPYYLSADEREIRMVDFPDHLAEMRRLGNSAKVIVVHGMEDTISPFAETSRMVELLKLQKFDVDAIFVNRGQIDGKVYTDASHSLGPRTEILFRVADKYLRADSTQKLKRKTSTDFFERDEIKYKTSHGTFVISYEKGFPVGSFVPEQTSADARRDH